MQIRFALSVLGLTLLIPLAVGGQTPEINLSAVSIAHPTSGSKDTPFTHLPYFYGERDRFGYSPRYTPAPVNFDLDNIPYIRVGVNPQGHDLFGEYTTLGIIQTLDAVGQWINLTSWLDAIKAQYPSWDGIYNAGVGNEEQIIFDGSGDAYTIVCTWYNSTLGYQSMLLYSRDKCRTWKAYPLGFSMYYAKLERPEAWNDTDNPPIILGSTYQFTGGPLYLIVPRKGTSNNLIIPAKVTLTSSADNISFMAPMHSGGSNSTITKGNMIYVVYGQNTPSPDNTSGTPQYILAYDRVAKTVTGPFFLGTSESSVPDVHEGPAITIDSQGYLHVLFGSHGGRFKYTKSLAPYSITGGWTTPVAIGNTGDEFLQWTYISLLCDKNDTLHVVGRYSGYYYYFGLWYMRKKAGQAWEENLGPLVMPFRKYYSCWYQKLTMDRQGRLFLSYIYYGNQYDRETMPASHPEIDNYTARWPWETPVCTDPVDTTWSGVQGHEPCVILSDDGGDHWRLALTTSLQVFFGNNTFENGLDGWKLTNSTSTNPICALSSYTYNGKTILPRTSNRFAVSERSPYSKKARRTVSPSQSGVFTGYLNMAEMTDIGMISISTPGHEFIVMASSLGQKVYYRIDAVETPTDILVSTQTWYQVKFVVGSGGVDAFWDGRHLFHSDLGTTVSEMSFGSNWTSAPCGYDDFSFVSLPDLPTVLSTMDTATTGSADIDGDGEVTSSDLAIVLANL